MSVETGRNISVVQVERTWPRRLMQLYAAARARARRYQVARSARRKEAVSCREQ